MCDETWLARVDGDRALGNNPINTWATFAIPFYYDAQSAADHPRLSVESVGRSRRHR